MEYPDTELQDAQAHAADSCHGHYWVHEDGSGTICLHCGVSHPDEEED